MKHIQNTVAHMKNDIMESIVKLLQNSKVKLPKGDDMGQGNQEDKDSNPMDQPSINKHALI